MIKVYKVINRFMHREYDYLVGEHIAMQEEDAEIFLKSNLITLIKDTMEDEPKVPVEEPKVEEVATTEVSPSVEAAI